MATVLLTIGVFALAALGLGLGVAFKRRPIQGSCGGVACLKALGLGCAGGCAPGEHTIGEHDHG